MNEPLPLPDSIWNFEDGSKGCTGDLDCEADVHMHDCFASPASWDGEELVRWAERYGHPEGWVKRAQAAHNRAENLYRDLETVRRYHGEEITAKGRLREAATRANQAMRDYNRNGLTWAEMDRVFADLERVIEETA